MSRPRRLLVLSLLVGCSDGGATSSLADAGADVIALADAATEHAGDDAGAGDDALDVDAWADTRLPDVEPASDAPGPVVVGGQCNGLVPDGPKVRTVSQPSGAALPIALGGAITPGRYHLASVLYYPLSSGCIHGEAPASGTLVVTATSSNGGILDFAFAGTAIDGTPVEIHSTSDFTSDGMTVTTRRTCPSVAAATLNSDYTATASALRLYERSAERCTVAPGDHVSVTLTGWIKD